MDSGDWIIIASVVLVIFQLAVISISHSLGEKRAERKAKDRSLDHKAWVEGNHQEELNSQATLQRSTADRRVEELNKKHRQKVMEAQALINRQLKEMIDV